MPSLTALEVARFHAALDLPLDVGAAARETRVQEVLAVMGLTGHQHTLVGGWVGCPGARPGRHRACVVPACALTVSGC